MAISSDNALLVVDVQNDFCPGGSLAVAKGDEVVPVINELMKQYPIIIGTQDWHPRDHFSFASNHEGKNPLDTVSIDGGEQVLWPDHCVQGTDGASFHSRLNSNKFNLIVRKGINPRIDSYSAFFENDRKTKTGLSGYLKDMGVSKLYICGLATDYCVFYSAMDALKLGYETYVLEHACRGVDFPKKNIEKSIATMKQAGISVISM